MRSKLNKYNRKYLRNKYLLKYGVKKQRIDEAKINFIKITPYFKCKYNI